MTKIKEVRPGIYDVSFKGKRLFLVGPVWPTGAHLATEDQLRWRQPSFAWVRADGAIMRHNKEVGRFDRDVTILRQLQKGLPDDGS